MQTHVIHSHTTDMLLTVGIVLFGITGVCTRCTKNGNEEWYPYGRHCYYMAGWDDLRNYDDAVQRCKELYSFLVSVTSLNETEFLVRDLIRCSFRCSRLNYMFWIGLRKTFTGPVDRSNVAERRENWNWQNGDDYNWHNWYSGTFFYEAEPDTASGHGLMYSDGVWGDNDPSKKYRYICEKSDMAKTMTSSGRLSSDVTSEPVVTTSSHVAASWQRTSMWLTVSTLIQGTTLSDPLTISPHPLFTSASRIEQPRKIEGGKDKTYVYVGVVLGVLPVAGTAVAIFVLLWGRRQSHSPAKSSNVTPQNETDESTREERVYVEQGEAPRAYYNDGGDLGPSLTNQTPSNGIDLFADIDRNHPRSDLEDTAGSAGDVSALYSVPHKGRRDDDGDDNELTIVENSAYCSY